MDMAIFSLRAIFVGRFKGVLKLLSTFFNVPHFSQTGWEFKTTGVLASLIFTVDSGMNRLVEYLNSLELI